MTPPIVVGFVLTTVIAAVMFSLWWGLDSDSRDHEERLAVHDGRLAVLEAALNLGGQPQAITDPPVTPDTEPMPAVEVAGGARKPTPHKRARHAA